MERNEIIKEFEQMADKVWASDINHTKIINSQKPIIGVRTPDLKAFARKIAKNELESTILALESEYFEEILLKGFLIGRIDNYNQCYNLLIDFLPHIDNWAVCDQTCSSLKIFKKDKDNKFFEKFLKLACDKREFYARTGVVMLMNYYLKPELIAKIFDCICKIENHKFYVDMAVAWLVSVAFVKFPEITFELLKSKKLQKRVQNKAICKCRDSFRVEKCKKEELKKHRIVK